MPLRIYLDTQDYVRLYKDRSKEHDVIFQYLLEKVNNGSIEICYSYVIITELLQNYKSDFKQDRIDRVQILGQLCNQNCFLYIERLRFSENPVSTIGDWLPKFSLTEMLESGIKNGLKESLKKLPRAQQRYFIRKDYLTYYIKNNPHVYNSALSQKDFDFPLPEIFLETNIFMKYLCGEISKSRMDREIGEILFDLNRFLITWFEYSRKENYLFELVRQSTNGYLKCVGVFSNILLKVQEARENIITIENQLKLANIWESLRQSIEESKKKLDLIENVDIEYVRSQLPPATLAKLPEHFLDLLLAYIRGSNKSNRNVSQSDGGDLLHAVYLPYCDLWRGDISFCSLLNSQKVLGYEKIVNKLVDLPNRIDLAIKAGNINASSF